MKDPLFVITTSDNHIGYLSVEQMVKEYYGEGGFLAQVESLIEENEIPKGQLVLAITGDYFDHQLSLNSNDASFAIDLMYSIIQIVVKGHEGLVILVQGTRSHDLNQLSIFDHLTEEYAGSFEIVKTVEAFEYKGYDILCVPEEYMTNPTEYYAEYFKEKYDLVLGHGFFKWNCFNKDVVERPVPGMPIFAQDEFIDMARLTIFGHDHRHQNYREQIYYNGSFSRLCHGEEYPKGFLMSYIDEDETETIFVENEHALEFKTISIETLFTNDLEVEKVAERIRKERAKVDNLKVKISTETVRVYTTEIEILVGLFNSQKGRGIILEAPTFSRRDGELVLLAEEDLEDTAKTSSNETKYGFLFNSGASTEDKILEFIKVKNAKAMEDKNISITLDDIRDAISGDK